jgi:hypothetical protein
VIAVIALDPHDEATPYAAGAQQTRTFYGDREPLAPSVGGSVLTSVLNNREQAEKANKKGWGDKSIGNTQSQHSQLNKSFGELRKGCGYRHKASDNKQLAGHKSR